MPDNSIPQWQILKLISQNILTFNIYVIELKLYDKTGFPSKDFSV